MVMGLAVHAYYQRFLPPNPQEEERADDWWDGFSTEEQDLARPLSEREVDLYHPYASSEVESSLVLRVIRLALQIIIFPWGLYELSRYVMQRFIMMNLYPAQSKLASLLSPKELSQKALYDAKIEAYQQLKAQGYQVREVVLQRGKVRYQGIAIAHGDTIDNGQWAMQATGNAAPVEKCMGYASSYRRQNYNLLLVNGPAVGLSEGHATPRTMGEAQEMGIFFLEKAIKADKIILAGCSLGAASMAKAIELHRGEFQRNVQYVAVRQMAFSSVARVAQEIIPVFKGVVAWLVHWSGCEMDLFNSSLHLEQRRIREVIVQACNPNLQIVVDGMARVVGNKDQVCGDGVIPKKSSYAYQVLHVCSLAASRQAQNQVIHGIVTHEGEKTHNSLQVIEDSVEIAANLLRQASASQRQPSQPVPSGFLTLPEGAVPA